MKSPNKTHLLFVLSAPFVFLSCNEKNEAHQSVDNEQDKKETSIKSQLLFENKSNKEQHEFLDTRFSSPTTIRKLLLDNGFLPGTATARGGTLIEEWIKNKEKISITYTDKDNEITPSTELKKAKSQ